MPDHFIFLWTLVFTVIYTTAAVVAIMMGWRQIRTSSDISNKEKSLDAYVNFSREYAVLTRLSHDIDKRFHDRDTTLCDYDIKYFFNAVWVLHLQEWEFLQAGILPVRIFSQWMMHTHEYLLSGKIKAYFGADGSAMQISTKEGFEKYGIRVLRFHPDFIAFVRELEQVPYEPAQPDAAFEPIKALVLRYKSSNDYWQ